MSAVARGAAGTASIVVVFASATAKAEIEIGTETAIVEIGTTTVIAGSVTNL